MDCKKALVDSDGDINKALSIIQKKRLYMRKTKPICNGRVAYKRSKDNREAALVVLYCQTDFAASCELFIKTVDSFAEAVFLCGKNQEAENILETIVKGNKYREILDECANQI